MIHHHAQAIFSDRHISQEAVYIWGIYSIYTELFGVPEPNVKQVLSHPPCLSLLSVDTIDSLSSL